MSTTYIRDVRYTDVLAHTSEGKLRKPETGVLNKMDL
jgi:hypothetical protein